MRFGGVGGGPVGASEPFLRLATEFLAERGYANVLPGLDPLRETRDFG
jgi:hypothetical protein